MTISDSDTATTAVRMSLLIRGDRTLITFCFEAGPARSRDRPRTGRCLIRRIEQSRLSGWRTDRTWSVPFPDAVGECASDGLPGKSSSRRGTESPSKSSGPSPGPWWRPATRNESDGVERFEGKPGPGPGYPDGSLHPSSLETGPAGVSLPLEFSDVSLEMFVRGRFQRDPRRWTAPRASALVERPTKRRTDRPGSKGCRTSFRSGLRPASCRFGRKRNAVSIPPVRGFPQEPGGHTASPNESESWWVPCARPGATHPDRHTGRLVEDEDLSVRRPPRSGG